MIDLAPVTIQIKDGVAHLRLSDAEHHNRIGPPFVAALADAAAECDGHSDVRAVLISAAGPSFSVGGDLDYLGERAERMAEELDVMIGLYHATLTQLAALPVPVVCAVQGGAAGGGLGLIWCADVVLAASDLKLTTGFANLGLSGDGGSSWALPRLVGARRARQLLMSPRVVGADEALDWGLVDRVVQLDDLRAEAEAEALRLAAGPTVAFGHLKRLLRTSWETSWPDQLAAERAAMVDCGGTADAREGVRSFIERRSPNFEGR
jgi:2-(1,2-epoxy-1,2-dihydrophenyl)acetyl-CoA isomerase